MRSVTTRKRVQNAIDSMEAFQEGNVKAIRTLHPDEITWGRMPETEKQHFLDIIDNRAAYVIYSYETPIAVGIPETEEWMISNVWYSNTTSKHQSLIDVMVRNPGMYS